jgi:hypothetical protein
MTLQNVCRFINILQSYDLGDMCYPNKLEVLFKSSSFYPLVRQQKLKIDEFSSYCGSCFGLFLGFSVLSAVELVYFFTIRLICFKRTSNRVGNSSEIAENFASEAFKQSTIHGLKNCVTKRSSQFDRLNGLVLLLFCLKRKPHGVDSSLFFGFRDRNSMFTFGKSPTSCDFLGRQQRPFSI